jgi:transposase
MAASPRIRARARELYIAGYSGSAVAERVGVAESTVKRWARRGDWAGARALHRQIEADAARLAQEMTVAAADSRDAQDTYAAVMARRAAGIGRAEPVHPEPRRVARALIRVLGADAEFGPLVRRRGSELVDLVAAEVERMEMD